jgi:hypothetical protein
MKIYACSKLFVGFMLLTSSALFASDIDDLRNKAKSMQTKAARLAEQGKMDQAQHLENESKKLLEMAERLEANFRDRGESESAFRKDREVSQLKDRLNDLRNKERILRDENGSQSDFEKVHGEIADIERELHKIHSRHSERMHGQPKNLHPQHRAQMEKLERVGQRVQHLRIASQHAKQAEVHELAHQLMAKAEDIERDMQAAKKQLAAEIQAFAEQPTAGHSELVSKLKEENERLRAEIDELKRNADRRY